MPDTSVAFDTLSNQSDASRAPLVTAAYMRGLWAAYEEARDAYREEDEERTGSAVTEAQERILSARTVDPEGVAIKLKLIVERDGDCPINVLKATIQDLTGAPRRSARAIPSRLRPIWDAYQTAWKDVSDATDEEDAAMVARPKGTEPGSTDAEKAAKAKRAVADKAFEAASEAFEEAPTRTFDDALCRIEYALDQVPPSDIAGALSAALRVLRKTGPAS